MNTTKHQSDPNYQGTCKFGRQHMMSMPIYRNGRCVADTAWAECIDCGRVEDETGAVVLDVSFPRCAR